MLAAMPAVVRFVSVEPMLGPINLRGISVVDWLIFGGESGPGARPMEEAWVRDGVHQCAEAGVACYVKQAGNVLARQWGCSDGKGDIIVEFPPDLRIQQYPS
jgi:protein gp37